MKTNTNKGITLIALVITVIVLLILAGTAISIAVNGEDLFGKAQNAVAQYNDKVAEEENKINEVLDMLEIDNDGVKQVNDANPGVLEGTGKEVDPYTINCIEDLVAFAYEVNNNNNLYEGKIVTLGCDLDFKNDKSYMNPTALYMFNGRGYFPNSNGTPIKTILTDETASSVGWTPIGIGNNDGFCGIFDGKKHTISNLYMKQFSYGGLFGETKKDITIRNLAILDCNITSAKNTGGILGYCSYSNGTARNCICSKLLLFRYFN